MLNRRTLLQRINLGRHLLASLFSSGISSVYFAFLLSFMQSAARMSCRYIREAGVANLQPPKASINPKHYPVTQYSSSCILTCTKTFVTSWWNIENKSDVNNKLREQFIICNISFLIRLIFISLSVAMLEIYGISHMLLLR
jgi:hypothetical protein